MSTPAEIAAGTIFEVVLLSVAGAVVYRFFAGRFLIPKREILLPNQLGVIVQGSSVVRKALPGAHWVRPGQKLIVFDARPRPFALQGVQVLSRDNGVLRISFTSEFILTDPAAYYAGSTDANEAFTSAVKVALLTEARTLDTQTLASMPEVLAAAVQQRAQPLEASLGLALRNLSVWEAVYLGQMNAPAPEQPATHSTVN